MPDEKNDKTPRTPGGRKSSRSSARKRKTTLPEEAATPIGTPAATRRSRKAAPSKPEARKPPARRGGTSAPRQPTKRPARGRQAAPAEAAGLSIVMVASEAHPFATTGGLAEVVAALPDALARLGHSVTVVLPRYRGVPLDGSTSSSLTVTLGAHEQPVTIHERALGAGVTAGFVDVPELFDREGVYGTAAGDYPDNAWRFALFNRAALEYIRARGVRPSVIHTHDWQTGLVPVYQKMHLSGDPIVGGVPAVFTIHNMAFQGLFPADTLPGIGLGWDVFNMQALEHWGRISYLKGGINFSEKITTVSPTYAREIVHTDLGFGFEGVLARRSPDLVGILNGIDVTRWNPEHDAFVPAAFSAGNLSGKQNAKRALLETAGLPHDDKALRTPVIGLISRLTDQKGMDLFAASVDALMPLDVRWVLLGSGEPRYEDLLRSLAARFPDRVSATIGFDERLAHLIEAGADIFLMPSRFEPCGLNQMYSLRYGTVPVVRGTGGLEDTVVDVDEADLGAGTGFKFAEYTPWALHGALQRALAAWRDPGGWRRIQEAGMARDSSWDASAREYVKLYGALKPVQARPGQGA